jgi:hypothetical protein
MRYVSSRSCQEKEKEKKKEEEQGQIATNT